MTAIYPICPLCGKEILPDHSRFKAWTTDGAGNTNERGFVHLSHVPSPMANAKAFADSLQHQPGRLQIIPPSPTEAMTAELIEAKAQVRAQELLAELGVPDSYSTERVTVLETILEGIQHELDPMRFEADAARAADRVRVLLRVAGFEVAEK